MGINILVPGQLKNRPIFLSLYTERKIRVHGAAFNLLTAYASASQC